MPVDSLDLLEILYDIRKETGLRLPNRELRHRTMQSVGAFTAFAAEKAGS